MTTPSRYRFVIEAQLFLLYAMFGVSWIGVTPLLPELQAHFGLTSAQLALVNTAVALAKVVAPLPAGLLAVRIGLSRTGPARAVRDRPALGSHLRPVRD